VVYLGLSLGGTAGFILGLFWAGRRE